jgi:XTP/dITP diphosphohydrolase
VADPRLVLVETSDALPGLLPPVAHQALQEVDRVLARDPDTHPAVPALAAVGIEVARAEPAAGGDVRGMDLLSAGGAAADVRLARGLLEATTSGDVAYLQGPGDAGFGRTLGMEAARAGGVEVEFVFLVGAPRGLSLLRLVEVMAALRDPETGCPWDLEQDHRSLARHLLEESYELLDAIASDDDAHMAEELGDVLLQVVFHAQVAFDRHAFGIDEVADGIADKLVRRHPHVFGDGDATTPEQVQANWDELKAQEKPHRTGPFDGVPTALPALLLAAELQSKAERTGFAFGTDEEVVAKVREELDEVLAADPDDVADEVGDLLLATASLARRRGVDPETALRGAASTFRTRFERILSRLDAQERDPGALTPSDWLALWDEVKAAGW